MLPLESDDFQHAPLLSDRGCNTFRDEGRFDSLRRE